MGITDKAMLINLHISQWTARKYDRSVSDHIEDEYDARDAGRYNKILIAQDAIKKINKISNKARIFHYENTLPWGDNDDRILPSANYFDYIKEMRKIKEQFNKTVEEFCETYPSLIEEAKTRLNRMFKDEDYPPVQLIHHKYHFEVVINPISNPNDFRVSINDKEVERIKKDIETRMNKAQVDAMKNLWDRLYEKVQKIADTLGKSDAIFRDSLIGNVVSLCELLPKLNIENDPELTKMKNEIENNLITYSPNDIRNNSKIREETADKADAILKKMASYIGGTYGK
jgi:HEPN domain-containing protein